MGSLNVVRLVTLLAFLALLSRANADTKVNPYESVAARNPFHLKDPPPPPDPNEVAKPPPALMATVEVTGIINIFKKKQAFLEIVPSPGKPVVRRTLGEGEREESIEVVSIDIEKNEVVLNNAGVVTNVALKAAAKSTAGAPGIAPGLLAPPVGNVTGFIPPPGGAAYAGAVSTPNPSGRASVMVAGGTTAAAQASPTMINHYGVNTLAPNYAPTYGTPNPGAQGPAGAYNPAGNTTINDLSRTIPNRQIRTQSTPPESTPIDPAVQYINMAVQKQQADRAGKELPPLPPIPGLDE